MTLETIVRDQLQDLELKVQVWNDEERERVQYMMEQVEAHNQWMAENRRRLTGLRGGIEALQLILQKADALGEDIHGDSE